MPVPSATRVTDRRCFFSIGSRLCSIPLYFKGFSKGGGGGNLPPTYLQSVDRVGRDKVDIVQASLVSAPVFFQAVRGYFRFTLSIRHVEELMAERGIGVSRETIRYWEIKFGPLIAANLVRCHRPTSRWHLDEAVVRIGGRRMYLWRAVNDEGEVLDVLAQKRRNKHAVLKLFGQLFCDIGTHPERIVPTNWRRIEPR